MTTREVGYIRPELDGHIVPIDTLTLYPGNPRRGDDPTIQDSLREHGQYQTVLVQASTGYVIGGNNLVRNMRAMGWTHAAALHLDVDDDRARRILLIDNAAADRARYDLIDLTNLVAELPDLTGSGYTVDDLDRWALELDGVTAELDDITTALPVSAPPGPPLPDRPTADPAPLPRPDPAALTGDEPNPPGPDAQQTPAFVEPQPPGFNEPPTPAEPGTPTPPPTRIDLPPVNPPTPRPARAPSSTAAWVLTLPLHDRDEARRLISHARDWLDTPDIDEPDVVLRALRTLAAIGDARHNTTATISIVSLLMAAGYDPLTRL